MKLVQNVGGKIKNTLAFTGAVATAGAYYQYKIWFPSLDDEHKILVIPFHRLILKDQVEQDWSASSLLLTSDREEERPMELELKELVDIIHNASSDPNIVGLYGIFGHDSKLPLAGWADLEEVRDALKVFKESHRVHPDPNLQFNKNPVVIMRENHHPKLLYAYADNFTSLSDPGNKDYYLASMFSKVHMQKNGELNLFGMLSSQLFFKDSLQKYGIKVHVFKHGDYKNFPNMFTERGYNKPHQEAMVSIVQNLQKSVCDDITDARSKSLYSAWIKKKNGKHDSNERLWKRILETGSFPAQVACKAGLVDYLPRRDPLADILAKKDDNADEEGTTKDKLDATETDLTTPVHAEKTISLKAYKSNMDKKKTSELKWRKVRERLSKYPSVMKVCTTVGLVDETASASGDKIALVHVQGAIGDATARKTIHSLRKIAQDKDTKAIVLRVNSPGGSIFACETISEELKRLEIPVVVSFGNVAASGGYYISAMSDRIFASHKTLTGSIGVFGIRADLTGFAKQYGVSSGSVATSDLSGTFSSMIPMSKKMQKVFQGSIDRYYDQFKTVVGDGRKLDSKTVETVAQGRVWTGDQAMMHGLVDELGGGLFRAIAYAERAYTSGDAQVVQWPKKQNLLERLKDLSEDGDPRRMFALLKEWAMSSPETKPFKESTMMMNQHNLAPFVSSLLRSYSLLGVPPTLSGIYLTVDENSALECLLEQTARPLGPDEVSSYLSEA